MRKKDYLSILLRSSKTVFSFKDIVLLWGDSGNAAKARINYYVKKGDLYQPRRGFYTKDKDYDKLELATKIYTPAYVSLETVLGQSGVNFQYYSQIFVVSYLTREIKCDGQKYSFRKIKNSILTNKMGLENTGGYFIASKERAYLDTLYLNGDYHFDSLNFIDWNKVFEILPIYNNKRMNKKVKEIYNNVK